MPILRPIKPSIPAAGDAEVANDDVIDLSSTQILASTQDIALALRRLSSLLNSNPNPSLSRRVLDPVFLELWALSSLYGASAATTETCCKPARAVLETYLKITASPAKTASLVKNLMFRGPRTARSHGNSRQRRKVPRRSSADGP